MKSVYSCIAEPLDGRRYANTKNIGGVDFIVSTSDEDHRFSNRFAKVISPPAHNPFGIQKDDVLLVHHNVFKFYNDMYGRQRSGRSFFRDNIFLIDPDQFFAFQRDGVWYGYDRYCFVKPVYSDYDGDKFRKEEPLCGELFIANDYLLSQGLSIGDIVYFTPDSKYEYRIDDQIAYRVYDHQITAYGKERLS